jgi:CheY-like chemotaxis protein
LAGFVSAAEGRNADLDGDQAMRRTGQDLQAIPVLILTTPAAPPDVQRSYSLHASAYIAKPVDLDGFTDAIRQIARWFLKFIELSPPS